MPPPNESQRIVNKNYIEPSKEEMFQMLGKDSRRESKSFAMKTSSAMRAIRKGVQMSKASQEETEASEMTELEKQL